MAFRYRAARDEHLSVESRRGCGDVRLRAEAGEQRTPVAHTVTKGAHEFYVRGGPEQAILQIAAHAVGDGEREDKRGDAGGDSDDGDGGDDADDGLPATGSKITRGDEEFKAHGLGMSVPNASEVKARG